MCFRESATKPSYRTQKVNGSSGFRKVGGTGEVVCICQSLGSSPGHWTGSA